MIASGVVLSLHALLALQPQPAAATAGDQTILWFRSPEAAAVDARALLDALSVYTRDLGVTVRTAAEPRAVPTDTPSARAAGEALRAHGARLGFWCEMRPGADVAALTVVGADGHLELHLVERSGAHEAEQYRAIALKLRSVLAGTARPEPSLSAAPPPAPAPPAPPAAAPGPELSVRTQPAPPPESPRRPFLSIGYRLSTPIDTRAFRHALALDAALAVGRSFELDLGTELAVAHDQQVAIAATAVDPMSTDVVSIFDWPIRAGGRVIWRRGNLTIGGGAFGALHLLWASITSDLRGAGPGSFTIAGGIGADALARLRLTGALAAELRVYAEVPAPTTRYSADGTHAFDLGARAGVGLGLAFPAP